MTGAGRLPMRGVAPDRGRGFTDGDDRAGAERVAVLRTAVGKSSATKPPNMLKYPLPKKPSIGPSSSSTVGLRAIWP